MSWHKCHAMKDVLLFLDLEGIHNERAGGHGVGRGVALTRLVVVIFIELFLQRCQCNNYENTRISTGESQK